MTVPPEPEGLFLRLANVGLHVADIERSLTFYRDVLGMRVHVDSGWDGSPSVLALSGNADATAIRIVNLVTALPGNTSSITLVQLTGTDRRPVTPRFQDPGGVHLAFAVTDLDAALSALTAYGVTPVAEPGEVAGGGAGHARVAFLRDPDGFFVELVQRLDASHAKGQLS